MEKIERTVIIIPARLNSSRLKNKLLLEVKNKPVIQWVYEAAQKSKLAKKVIIACDSEEIFNKARNFNADVEMTSIQHKSGSDRIAEVVKRHPKFDYILNLQGDEPQMTSEAIDKLLGTLHNTNAEMATLVREITEDEQINDPNCVKCVFDKNNYALYFSRCPVPYPRNKHEAKYYAHIGMYAYTKKALLTLTSENQVMLEKAESLEQLRALYNNISIKVIETKLNPVGIDTIQDFEKFKKIVEELS